MQGLSTRLTVPLKFLSSPLPTEHSSASSGGSQAPNLASIPLPSISCSVPRLAERRQVPHTRPQYRAKMWQFVPISFLIQQIQDKRSHKALCPGQWRVSPGHLSHSLSSQPLGNLGTSPLSSHSTALPTTAAVPKWRLPQMAQPCIPQTPEQTGASTRRGAYVERDRDCHAACPSQVHSTRKQPLC